MLLIILFITFIVMGLPRGLLGSAWPVMQGQWDVPVYYAGIISVISSAGQICAALTASRLTRFIRPGVAVVGGVLLAVVAMLGFMTAGHIGLLFLCAIPLGYGAGIVDAVMNHYFATHYTSRHINWLHCFWGVGAMAGPYIMGFFLARGMNWHYGYGTVAVIQLCFIFFLIASLPKWRKDSGQTPAVDSPAAKSILQLLSIRGIKFAMLALFGYCAVEGTAMLWASTYLVSHRGVAVESAAVFGSLFFIGITAGRMLSGIVSNRLGNKKMIYIGLAAIFAGIVAIGLPGAPAIVCLAGLVTVGLGCGPIVPSFIHATPDNFGAENSQALVGAQMAGSYTGATVIPPLFGWLAGRAGVGAGIFPLFLLVFLALTLGMTVMLYRKK